MRINGENKIVGTATYAVYDAVAEAVDGIGEEKTLELINAQVRTNEMNRVRGLARGGPSKKALEFKALERLTPEDFARVAGKPDAIRQLIDQKIEEIRAELKLQGIGLAGDDEE